jgi:hypothetical protein
MAYFRYIFVYDTRRLYNYLLENDFLLVRLPS